MGNYSGLFANCVAYYDGTRSGATLKNLVSPGTYDGTFMGTDLTDLANNFGILKAFRVIPGAYYASVGNTGQSIKSIIVLYRSETISMNNSLCCVHSNNSHFKINSSGVVAGGSEWVSPSIYVNGVISTTGNTDWSVYGITSGTAVAGSTVYIGYDLADYAYGWFGGIAFFSEELSAAKVAALSKLLLTKPIQNPSNLRSWWA